MEDDRHCNIVLTFSSNKQMPWAHKSHIPFFFFFFLLTELFTGHDKAR